MIPLSSELKTVNSVSYLDDDRSKFLKCSILKLQKNLLPSTPSDIFLWVPENATRYLPLWLSRLTNVYILPIETEVIFHSYFLLSPPPIHTDPSFLDTSAISRIFLTNNQAWNVPTGQLSNDTNWVGRDAFELDYYLTGRWRLTFSLDFAYQMGYRCGASLIQYIFV